MMFACIINNSTQAAIKQATIDLTDTKTPPLLLLSGKSDLIWHSEVCKANVLLL
jgi:hypothetical protein